MSSATNAVGTQEVCIGDIDSGDDADDLHKNMHIKQPIEQVNRTARSEVVRAQRTYTEGAKVTAAGSTLTWRGENGHAARLSAKSPLLMQRVHPAMH